MSDAAPVVLVNVLPEPESNPFLALWTESARRAGARLVLLDRRSVLARGADRPDWLHLQWPDWTVTAPRTSRAAWNVLRLLLLVAAARVRGARVMVTAHNVWSHHGRHPRLEAVLWSVLGLLTTDLHLLSAAGAQEFVGSHPTFRRAKRRVIPHGDYGPVVEAPPSRDAARESLGIARGEGRVLVTFGSLQRYKGVGELLAAFRELDDDGARLIVAGRVKEAELAHDLEETRRADPRVHAIPEFLSQADLAQVIRAADAVVLPYRRVLNSGSALLALTLGRPVIVPSTPTFEELRDRVGGGWVRLFAGPLASEDLRLDGETPPDGEPDLAWCSWDVVTEELRSLWRG